MELNLGIVLLRFMPRMRCKLYFREGHAGMAFGWVIHILAYILTRNFCFPVHGRAPLGLSVSPIVWEGALIYRDASHYRWTAWTVTRSTRPREAILFHGYGW